MDCTPREMILVTSDGVGALKKSTHKTKSLIDCTNSIDFHSTFQVGTPFVPIISNVIHGADRMRPGGKRAYLNGGRRNPILRGIRTKLLVQMLQNS